MRQVTRRMQDVEKHGDLAGTAKGGPAMPPTLAEMISGLEGLPGRRIRLPDRRRVSLSLHSADAALRRGTPQTCRRRFRGPELCSPGLEPDRRPGIVPVQTLASADPMSAGKKVRPEISVAAEQHGPRRQRGTVCAADSLPRPRDRRDDRLGIQNSAKVNLKQTSEPLPAFKFGLQWQTASSCRHSFRFVWLPADGSLLTRRPR